MIEFTRYEGALQWPGRCVCGSQTQPMVDTHIDQPRPQGRVYLCALCVTRAALALGTHVPVDRYHEVVRAEQDAADRIAGLQRELADARDPAARVITAGELAAWLREQQEVGA